MEIKKDNPPTNLERVRRGSAYETKVNRFLEQPIFRTSGNVTMAQSTVYTFPNPYGAKQVMFYGIASNGGTIRVDCFGVAQLGPSYYFTPESPTSVGLAGERQKLIQSGKWFLVTTGAVPQYRARPIETTLVNIDWPTEVDIVARAEIISYDSNSFKVKVDLAPGWQIAGNFVCT
jgi:hypothetical protein